jgi:1-acyl-sn-glycerol-3-phosphate acyltransferase
LPGFLRLLIRIPLILLSILILVISWVLPWIAWRFSARAGSHLRVRLMGIWARVALRILGFRVTREGDRPQVPFFLVTNHLSYMDVLVLWSQLDVYFLGKSELAHWPGVGPLIRAAGTMFIDRQRKTAVLPAVEAIKKRLALGNGVVVFPEGTSSSGGRILRLRRNMFEVALRADIPVHIGCLHYTVPDPRFPVETTLCWWGDMTFIDHLLGVFRIPRVEARLRFADQPITGATRRELAAKAEQQMNDLFEPLHDWSRVDPDADDGIPDN